MAVLDEQIDFIKNVLTFPRWRRAQIGKVAGDREKLKGLGRHYNKDVGRHNKAMSGQAYGSGGHNKENDEEMKRLFRKNSAGKEDLR